MKIQFLEYSNRKSILNTIIFLILGILLFTNPIGILNFISVVFSIFLAIIGLGRLFNYYSSYKKTGIKSQLLLYSAMFILLSSVVVLFLTEIIELLSRLFIGVVIIYTAIFRIIGALNNKDVNFIFNLIVSILIFVCGFWVLLNANIGYQIIGLVVIIASVLDIINFINFNKEPSIEVIK